MVSKKFLIAFCVLCVALIHVGNGTAWGAPVSLNEAESVAQNWISRTQLPISREDVGFIVNDIVAYKEEGRNLFYLVTLYPSGWLVVGADTRQEPVLAFGRGMIALSDIEGTFYTLLRITVPAEMTTESIVRHSVSAFGV